MPKKHSQGSPFANQGGHLSLRTDSFKKKEARDKYKRKGEEAQKVLKSYEKNPVFKFVAEIKPSWWTVFFLLAIAGERLIDAAEAAESLNSTGAGSDEKRNFLDSKNQQPSSEELATQALQEARQVELSASSASAATTRPAAADVFLEMIEARIRKDDPNKAKILLAAKKIPKKERWVVENCLGLETGLKITTDSSSSDNVAYYNRRARVRFGGTKEKPYLTMKQHSTSIIFSDVYQGRIPPQMQTDFISTTLEHEFLHCNDMNERSIEITVIYPEGGDEAAKEVAINTYNELEKTQTRWHQNDDFYQKQIKTFTAMLENSLDPKKRQEKISYFAKIGLEVSKHSKAMLPLLYHALTKDDAASTEAIIQKKPLELHQAATIGQRTIRALLTIMQQGVQDMPEEFVANLYPIPSSVRKTISPEMDETVVEMVKQIKQSSEQRLSEGIKEKPVDRVYIEIDKSGRIISKKITIGNSESAKAEVENAQAAPLKKRERDVQDL